MARRHIYRPIQDNAGTLVTDASVAVYNPGTTTPIAQTLYEDPVGVDTRANPFAATSGYVDFYLDDAALVRIGITRPSVPEFFIENIAIGDPDEKIEDPPIQSIVLQWQGDLVATTEVARWTVPEALTLIDVRANLVTPPTGSSAIIDVLKNGTSLWDSNAANRPTIAAAATTDLAGAPDSSSLAANDDLLVVVDQHGSAVPGAHLIVTIRVQAA